MNGFGAYVLMFYGCLLVDIKGQEPLSNNKIIFLRVLVYRSQQNYLLVVYSFHTSQRSWRQSSTSVPANCRILRKSVRRSLNERGLAVDIL
jgi:hypothetical protein